MIINKIKYKVYGKLTDVVIDLEKGMNLLYGKNEAGKSTIFDSIASLIYGFRPVSREKHPYVHWEKNEINFSAEIEEKEELFTVERSLRSVPKCVITDLNERKSQIFRNEPLPFVNTVSASLFDSLFYLNAEDLNHISNESWESIQSKLIFNFGSDYLKKSSDVVQRLEEEINSLWRNDKKGNPFINSLYQELRGLKLEKADAEKRQLKHSHLIQQTEHSSIKLHEFEQERQQHLNTLKSLREILPIIELERKIAQLYREIIHADEFDKLDPNLIQHLDQQELELDQMSSQIQTLEDSRKHILSQLFPLSEKDRQMIAFMNEAEGVQTTLNELNVLESHEQLKMDEFLKGKEKSDHLFKMMFGLELDETGRADLLTLDVMQVSTQIQKHIEKNQKDTNQTHQLKNKSKLYLSIMAAAGLASIILLMGAFSSRHVLLFVFSAGSAMISAWSTVQHRHLKKRVKILENEHHEDEQMIKSILIQNSIILPDYVLEDDKLRFFTKLEQLIMSVLEDQTRHEQWISLVEKRKNSETKVSSFLESHGFDVSLGIKLKLQYLLSQGASLLEQSRENDRIQDKVIVLEDQIETLKASIQEKHSQTQTLKETLAHFGSGDIKEGRQAFEQNLSLKHKIGVYEEEYRQLKLEKVFVEMPVVIDPYILEAKISDLELSMNEMKEQILNARQEINILNEMKSVEAFEDEILYVEDQIEKATQKRNTLMMLKEVIVYSDEKFRLKNQPNIIHRVSHFMNVMTQGKYQEVILSQTDHQYELLFMIDSETVPANRAFSKGTLQQLFFAYRLAVIEAVDPNGQMPLLLDETFINWDKDRFKETLSILKEVSEKRQILFFTCHEAYVDMVRNQWMTHVIEVKE